MFWKTVAILPFAVALTLDITQPRQSGFQSLSQKFIKSGGSKSEVGAKEGDGSLLSTKFHLPEPTLDGETSSKLPALEDHSLLGYPASYYRAVNQEPLPYRGTIQDRHSPSSSSASKQVVTKRRADVVVIGGGLAGVNTALGLAERGVSVVLLESKRIGWNASGRNGGFAIAGVHRSPSDIIEDMGEKKARAYYQRTIAAQNKLRERIDTYLIQCDVQDTGGLEISTFPHTADETKEELERINAILGTSFEFWSAEKCRALYHSPKYHHASYDPSIFTVQPLGLVAGLARAAESNGVEIYENSPARRIQENPADSFEGKKHRFVVFTGPSDQDQAQVYCDNVVLAGSCHLDPALDFLVARSVTPLYTYIGVTKPLGEKLQLAISSDAPYPVCDDITCLNYFRPLPDGRLLWGGLAQVNEVDHDAIAPRIQSLIHEHFPQLAKEDLQIEYSWGGDIGIEIMEYPLIGKRKPGLYYATGFGGHGLVPTTMAAEMIAQAIASANDQEIEAYQNEFPLLYAGWPLDRLASQSIYYFFQLCDLYHATFKK